MTMLEIIEKKKWGQALNEAEIRFFAEAAAAKSVPDYQLAAMLMAIRLNGMTDEETTLLTLAMRDSGDVVDLSSIPGIKVDKHSTGGVGDTTTLVLAPLVAACGAPVAKMSGRGLGHTGGTLDKMESIPGMRVALTEEAFLKQVREIGVAVVGQTGRLAPADRTLYALRDVTATVDSIPLIVSSILSKKLAAGSDAIVLDVKTGSGALMRDLESSIHLAEIMVRVGTLAGKPTVALISGMDQPLGTHVGNALEVREAIDILAGRAGGDLKEVSLTLGGFMLMLAGKAGSHDEAVRMLEAALDRGAGLRKLREMIAAQGGDPRVCEDPDLLPQAPVRKTVFCGQAGYVSKMDTTALGLAAQAMGAGRLRAEDPIDYAVGYVLRVRLGDQVTPETPLCELHARTGADAVQAEAAIRAAISISDTPREKARNFLALITRDGVIRYGE
ncbi:MAG: thymidine phosphorylase [Clostridia bacterium]|nr:thymidine phosphorylase [Clostridia bacterium]